MISVDDHQLFSAPVLWVTPGTTVTWDLRSGSHSATAYAATNGKPDRIPMDAEGWDSGVLSQEGATYEWTFGAEGVYDYYCIPHEAVGMIGRIIAGTPDLQNAPALAEPQDSLPERAQEVLRRFNALTRAMVGEGSQGQT